MIRRAVILIALAALSACKEDMVEQPKFTYLEPSEIWADGGSARPLVPGTVARGALAAKAALAEPPEITAELLARGRGRYDIFCAPCHGLTGAGDGRVVQRGFPAPPSYLTARLRAAPARHFVEVMTNGYGVMYPYADRVPPRDRWAITAYIRALQAAAPEVPPEAPARAAVPTGGQDDR
ncbi:c-type cytochrome [Pelagivirga sediminicola]|uniref:c-type cytochrome n=1 Tax=Pelagivirga sediminicola TaxID=2170575 RepID=UPI001FAF3E12|nr:cytochrome c [Pelagivirga sediminicola]